MTKAELIAQNAILRARAERLAARLDRVERGPLLYRTPRGGVVTGSLVAEYVEAMRPTCAFSADQVLAWAAVQH